MDALGRRLRGHILEVLAQQVGRLISSRAALEDVTNPLPDSRKRGTSIFPTLPVLPLSFIGAAVASDALFATDWGSKIIWVAHLGAAALFAWLFARNAWRPENSTRAWRGWLPIQRAELGKSDIEVSPGWRRWISAIG